METKIHVFSILLKNLSHQVNVKFWSISTQIILIKRLRTNLETFSINLEDSFKNYKGEISKDYIEDNQSLLFSE